MSIKLSQFKNTNITKKIEYKDGKMEIISPGKLEGEIIFYDIMSKKEEINNIIQNLKGNETEDMVTYLLLPCLCNVERDVTYDEFIGNELMENPSTQFSFFLKSLSESINDIFIRADNFNSIKNNSDMINKKAIDLNIKETPEQEMNRLANELPKINDKEQRKKIFRRIAELQNLIGD